MNVKNLNGTTTNNCKCDSWIDHWKSFSGQTVKQCVVKGCTNNPEVGGHVKKDSKTDSAWYIIPICDECNKKRGQDLDVHDKVNLVSANVASTCGKEKTAEQ